ncbi:MAG: hypothetical protein ACRCXK_09105 [Wohlfahrtiimonas sp.]
MFEKIAISITALLAVMFIAFYYYQSGTEAPQECIELHRDYTKLSSLIESEEYKLAARKIFSKEKILHIHNIEQHYHRLLQERFRRSGFNDFKSICINAKSTMNLPEIIQALEEQRQKNLEEVQEDSHHNYNFLI